MHAEHDYYLHPDTRSLLLKRGILALFCALTGCATAPPRASLSPADAGRRSEATAQELFDRGLALARAGQLVRAEQYLSLAWARGFREEQALPVLLRVCLASSRLRTALGYAESRLARQPGDWPLRYLVASICLAIGDHIRAREELERVVAINPSFAPAHYLLGKVMRDAFADPRSASRSFAAYLKLAPLGEHADEAAYWIGMHPTRAEADAEAMANKPIDDGGARP
jgi:tetratricopeptide (TPR) repeat protein